MIKIIYLDKNSNYAYFSNILYIFSDKTRIYNNNNILYCRLYGRSEAVINYSASFCARTLWWCRHKRAKGLKNRKKNVFFCFVSARAFCLAAVADGTWSKWWWGAVFTRCCSVLIYFAPAVTVPPSHPPFTISISPPWRTFCHP